MNQPTTDRPQDQSLPATPHGCPADADHDREVPEVDLLSPLTLRSVALRNRIVMSPMCQYVAEDGLVGDWHLVHLGTRALGGAGLVMAEMTDVSREGRISPGCAGLYEEAHARAWKRIVDFVHRETPSGIGIQLGHAGRKGATRRQWEGDNEPLEEGAWPLVAPSALPYDEENVTTSAPEPLRNARRENPACFSAVRASGER